MYTWTNMYVYLLSTLFLQFFFSLFNTLFWQAIQISTHRKSHSLFSRFHSIPSYGWIIIWLLFFPWQLWCFESLAITNSATINNHVLPLNIWIAVHWGAEFLGQIINAFIILIDVTSCFPWRRHQNYTFTSKVWWIPYPHQVRGY